MDHFDVRLDKNKNRIYCILRGYFMDTELLLAAEKLKSMQHDLKPGFEILHDIDEMKTDYLKSKAKLNNILDNYCNTAYRVICISKQSKLKNGLNRIKDSLTSKPRMIYFQNINQAIEQMDKIEINP